MNPDLQRLQAYPFARLKQLFADSNANEKFTAINLSIGEPKHEPPAHVLDAIQSHLGSVAKYPSTKGTDELRETIATWLRQRFSLAQLSADSQVLPVNGTREALFAFAQAVIDRTQKNPLVLSPNPFYQIYEGAAILGGAKLEFLDCTKERNYLADFSAVSEQTWQDCQLIYICSPSNPSGAVIPMDQLKQLIQLSQQYDFIIASDECYSEIFTDNAPIGLLEACQEAGNIDYKNCVVFHSLSKRSNLPGLRSGFIAGDADILQAFFDYRTYHGCAMSLVTQHASVAAWSDEKHVEKNREMYQQKFAAVEPIFSEVADYRRADASFYAWLPTPICDQQFAKRLLEEKNVTVLPGSFLSRENNGINPGKNHVRIALVAPLAECIEATNRIRDFILALSD